MIIYIFIMRLLMVLIDNFSGQDYDLPNTKNFALANLTKVWDAKLQGLNWQPVTEFFLFECSVGDAQFFIEQGSFS